VDDHIAPFLREGQGCLPFEVKVFLPADLDHRMYSFLCVFNGFTGIAGCINARAFFKPAVGGKRLING